MLFTSTEWTEQGKYQFAQTNDPRILAVIERDEDAQISELYDGDAINPIIYVEHRWGRKFSWVAGYDGGEAETIQRANDHFDWPIAKRYLWIFHGIAAEDTSGGYDRDGSWIVVTSRAYREHVGVTEEPASYDEAREDCLSLAKDLGDALDGYVYGLGWATNEARLLHDDEEIEINEGWSVEMESWGYVGEDYARQCAAAFEVGEPELAELITNAEVFA